MLKYVNDPTIIAFTRARLPYGWLGNMSAYPVTIFEVCWPTAEHAFQAMRVHENYWNTVRDAASPMTAKMLVRGMISRGGYFMVVEPRTVRDIENMRTVLMQKVIQNPKLAVALLQTGDSLIVEDVTKQPHDLFWGMKLVGDHWVGDNMLGLLWMGVRARLRGIIPQQGVL
jgi:ribA/ribD-fused uncharacterized protein